MLTPVADHHPSFCTECHGCWLGKEATKWYEADECGFCRAECGRSCDKLAELEGNGGILELMHIQVAEF